MTLQKFNVFGKVAITSEHTEIQFVMFKENKQFPTTISTDEECPQIPKGRKGEFLFGMDVNGQEHHLFSFDTQEVDGLELASLPVVKKHMEIIAENIRKSFLSTQ